VCANQPVTLQATGAGSYVWSTGDQTDIVTVTPYYAGIATYTVTGTNTVSGCSSSMVQQVMVNPAPIVSAFAHPPVVCEGSPVNLYATGASNYIWSNNGTGNVITINAQNTGTQTMNVIGSNQYNCQGTTSVQFMVNAKPNITVSSPSAICVGDEAQITASGGVSYQIYSPNSLHTTNPAFVMPTASTQYTIWGTDANGCQNFTVATMAVNECAGIAETSSLFGLRVYPNPTNGNLNIELNTTAQKNVQVVDLTGRVVYAAQSNASTMQVDLSQVANGVYYVKIQSAQDSQVIKVIRN
jgi:hypothetical protein